MVDGNSYNITTDDTFGEWHEYEIRWTPDKIDWLVDGKSHRTKERKDTWNSTSQSWDFPQTPARVQLSIWPGGKASNAEGTINWAGGVISWDHPDVKNNGYYYASVKSVEIECYAAKKAPGTNKGKSYVFTDARATNDTVSDTDKDTILGSFGATGLDMDYGKTDSSDKPKSSQASIPGGGSPGGNDHSDQSGSGSKGNSQPPPQSSDPKTCDPKVFSQSCGGEATETKKNFSARAAEIGIGQWLLLIVTFLL